MPRTRSRLVMVRPPKVRIAAKARRTNRRWIGTRERRLEGVEDRTNLLGKSVVIPLKTPPREHGPCGPADAAQSGAIAGVALGRGAAGLAGYSTHGGLPV